jgi:hypothetical protein
MFFILYALLTTFCWKQLRITLLRVCAMHFISLEHNKTSFDLCCSHADVHVDLSSSALDHLTMHLRLRESSTLTMLNDKATSNQNFDSPHFLFYEHQIHNSCSTLGVIFHNLAANCKFEIFYILYISQIINKPHHSSPFQQQQKIIKINCMRPYLKFI